MKWITDHLWLFWCVWIFGIASYFALFETIAIVNKGQTFSNFFVTVGMAWPPWFFLWAFLVGLLVAHFLWVWNNPIGKWGSGG